MKKGRDGKVGRGGGDEAEEEKVAQFDRLIEKRHRVQSRRYGKLLPPPHPPPTRLSIDIYLL